jgi:hypothetical protein
MEELDFQNREIYRDKKYTTYEEDILRHINLNINLKTIYSLKLISDEKTIYWNSITIIAPHLSTSTKKNIKQKIKYMDLSDIVHYIKDKYGNIHLLINKKKTISFEIKQSNITPEKTIMECQICFQEYEEREALCGVCIHSEICEQCEMDTRKKFNRCAFCNTSYDSIDID